MKKGKNNAIKIVILVIMMIGAIVLLIVIYEKYDYSVRIKLEAKIDEIDYVYIYNFDGTYAGKIYFATNKYSDPEKVIPLDITVDGEMYKGSKYLRKEEFIRTAKGGQVNGTVYFKDGTSSDFSQIMPCVYSYFSIGDYRFEIPEERWEEHLKIQRQIGEITRLQ